MSSFRDPAKRARHAAAQSSQSRDPRQSVPLAHQDPVGQLPLFRELDDETREAAVTWLRDHAEPVRVDPGQPIFKQGDVADNFYIVSLGFVKVSQKLGEGERVVRYLGPGSTFGEIALLTQLNEISELSPSVFNGKRTATCAALDHVELFSISSNDFRTLIARFPALKESFIAEAHASLNAMKNSRNACTPT